ncbi:hypothetical protein AZ044_004714, partial [Pluralibacter gergoviae]
VHRRRPVPLGGRQRRWGSKDGGG